MKSDNIILIGMPASGKSTVGVILAKILGFDFLDTDLLIQRKENARLEDIIAVRGVDGFLSAESGVCLSLDVRRTVIATGGSVVYSAPSMRHLMELGTVVYLKTSLLTVVSRISDMTKRGVVRRPGQSTDDLYRERCLLYEKYADVTVDEENLTLEQTVGMLAEKIEKYLELSPAKRPAGEKKEI